MSNPAIPTADQIAETRTKLWHQSGAPLLTIESLRAWLNQAGLVLYSPRPQQLPSPAPSLVEAVLGAPNPAPTPAESEQARTLTMRLIAEGSAVPLNLLGTQGISGDAPDFICSAQVFSYIFTLRGDKAWKQPPATTGAVKVTPLGLAAYELLSARVTLSAADLATELGKEVTEAAVLRALAELWSHLRVIPVPQTDGAVMWELASTRFTKQIKAGANAGQPSALSALISLYLGMAVAASEEEIETILSPLASRSRIRDVVHALTGARQLEPIAIAGRTVLHISGDLPAFTSNSSAHSEGESEVRPAQDLIEVEASSPAAGEADGGTSRITKFVPRPRKTGTGPAKSFNPRPGPLSRPASGPPNDRERRPFQKKPFDSPRPGFTKPWNEGRGDTRPPRIDAEGAPEARRARPTFARNEGGTRPTFRRDEGSALPRRDFAPRTSHDANDSRAPRKTFSKPGTFGRKRDEAAGRPSSFGAGESRPPRRDFNTRPAAPNAGPRQSFGGGDRPGRPESSDRPKRTFDARPSSGGERRPGSYTPRPQSSGTGFAGRKPFTPRENGGESAPRRPFTPGGKPFGKPSFSRERGADGGAEAPRKIFRKFDAPRFDRPRGPRDEGAPSDRPKSAYSKSSGNFSSKPGGTPARKPFARASAKPLGTYAKFADGKKPFGKKFGAKPSGPTGAYRKAKPAEGDA